MKPIPSAEKEKRRYIKFRLLAKSDFTENQVKHALNQSVFDFVGEKGFSEANFRIMKYNKEEMSGVARTTLKRLDDVLTTLTLLNDVQGKKAFVLTYGISGMLNKAVDVPAPNILMEGTGKQEELEKEMDSDEILGFMEKE